jgi:hypothetical protein
MNKKYYWLVSFLEKHPDGAVRAYKTALHCKTLAEAAETMSAELYVRARANGTECLLYDIGIADDGIADLVGKAEADELGIEWPE